MMPFFMSVKLHKTFNTLRRKKNLILEKINNEIITAMNLCTPLKCKKCKARKVFSCFIIYAKII